MNNQLLRTCRPTQQNYHQWLVTSLWLLLNYLATKIQKQNIRYLLYLWNKLYLSVQCICASRLTIFLLNPTGAFLKPFIEWKIPPPMAPMIKAPPESSRIRQGQGSRVYSSILYRFSYPGTPVLDNYNLKISTGNHHSVKTIHTN